MIYYIHMIRYTPKNQFRNGRKWKFRVRRLVASSFRRPGTSVKMHKNRDKSNGFFGTTHETQKTAKKFAKTY